jgi:hypothetical protein
MIVIWPFWRRCAMVSAPLPVRSRYPVRPEYREGVAIALGRHVDVPAGPFFGQAGSSRHKEDRLPGDKLPEPLVQLGVELAHVALLDAFCDELTAEGQPEEGV